MSENITFRSALSGFNRTDVMEYIKKIMDESEEKSAKIRTLEQQLADKDSVIEDLTEKAKNANACENCDLAKQNEVKIGAAMLDARRFSDLIVCEASDRAENMYSMACADAVQSSNQALELAEKINEDAKSYAVVFEELAGRMTELSDRLSGFGAGVEENKKHFSETFAKNEDVDSAEKTDKREQKEQQNKSEAGNDEETFAPVFDFLESVDDMIVKVTDDNNSDKK